MVLFAAKVNDKPIEIDVDISLIDLLLQNETFLFEYMSNVIKHNVFEGFDKEEKIHTIEIIVNQGEDNDIETQAEIENDILEEIPLDIGSSSSNNYTTPQFDEDLFISLVAECEPLYNFKLPLSERSKSIKEKLWQEIKTKMKINLPISELIKKWKALRDYYIKLKGEIEVKIPSGSSGFEKINRKNKIWKHYNAMKFLDIQKRKTISNINNEKENVKREGEISDLKIHEDTPKSAKKHKLDIIERQDNVFLQKLDNILNKTQEENNGIESFCIRLAEGLGKLSYKKRSLLEIKMLQLLYEAEESDELG